MYRQNKMKITSMEVKNTYDGETIEEKVRRIMSNKEPITDGAPLVYTDRSEGVRPETDIRTDRFEIAVDAMDKVTKTTKAKREEKNKPPKTEEKSDKKDNGGETSSTPGTEPSK